MTLATWPDAVPHVPLNESLQVLSHQAPLRTEMNGGNQRMRRQYTLRISLVKMTLRLTNAQLAALKSFVFETLSEGTQKFTMPVFSEAGCVAKTCQLSDGTFTANRSGRGWTVGLQLNVENY